LASARKTWRSIAERMVNNMAGLTAGRNTPELAEGGKSVVLPVGADAVIYEGSLVVLNAGYAEAGTAAENLVAVGRAEEYVDNTGGEDGDKTIRVRRGVFVWNNSGTAENKVGVTGLLKDCYIEDDNTVTSLATGSPKAGKVIEVTDDGVAVETL